MTLLSAFNPHEFSEATVRTVATGRERDLDRILTTIRSNLESKTIQHLIVSAPRGYGKSFMMRHVQIEVERIVKDEGLPLAVVLMPEEMPHVKEPETLIRELRRALTGGAGKDAELTWHEDEGAAWEEALDELNAAVRETVGERGLFVALVENFDALLRRAFPKEVQSSRLRAYLTAADSRTMLIAASASGAFDRDYNKSLFQAFKEVPLAPWSVDNCLVFFDRQRTDARQPPLNESVRARAKSVASFIGGTPRLATLLGDALFDEDVLRAADLLQKLVDELTPYYQERIEALPGRAQKLLDALLRGGEPATQSEIAQRVNARSQAAIAGPFKDLVKERIVIGEKATGSSEVLYRVADRVFAHYYRRRIVDHGGSGCPLEALVDLLADFFSPQEKQTKAAEFARHGKIEEARLMARLHDAELGAGRDRRRWMLFDLANRYIPDRLLPIASPETANRLRAIADFAARRAIDQAYSEIGLAIQRASPKDRVLLLLARSSLDAYENIEGGLAAADEAAATAEGLGDDHLASTAKRARAWSLAMVYRNTEALDLLRDLAEHAISLGLDLDAAAAARLAAVNLSDLDRHEEAVEVAKQAADRAAKAGDVREETTSLRIAAFSLSELGHHEEAVEIAKHAADRAGKVGDVREEATSLCLSAFILGRLGRMDNAVETAKQAANRADDAGDIGEEARSLRLAAFFLSHLDRYDEAAAIAKQAADRAGKAGEMCEEATSLRVAAFNLGRLGHHEEAASTANRGAGLALKAGDKIEEAMCLRHAAFHLGQLGHQEEAEDAARQAADLAAKMGDRREEAASLVTLGSNLAKRDEHATAISVFGKAADILDEHVDDEIRDFLVRACSRSAARASIVLATEASGLDWLHALLQATVDQLDVDGLRRICLRTWVSDLASGAIRRIRDPVTLGAWATAIDAHFAGRFGDEVSRLRDAAHYHRSGRDPKELARLDPDVARTLQIMFPTPEDTPPKKTRKRKSTTKRKSQKRS